MFRSIQVQELKKENQQLAQANSVCRLGKENLAVQHRQALREKEREYQLILDKKDRMMAQIKQDAEQETLAIISKVDLSKQEFFQLELQLRAEMKQMEAGHLLEFQSLQKQMDYQLVLHQQEVAELNRQLSFSAQTNENLQGSLKQAESTIKSLEETLSKEKWNHSATLQKHSTDSSNLERLLSESCEKLTQEKNAFDLQIKALESSHHLEKTNWEWNLDQIQAKLNLSQDLVKSLSDEKDQLKNSLLDQHLQYTTKHQEFETFIEKEKQNHMDAIHHHERVIKDLQFQLEKSLKVYESTKEKQAALENESKAHLELVQELRNQLETMKNDDVLVEDRFSQEQYILESQFQLEIKKRQKAHEQKFQALSNENRSLNGEIKVMKKRLVELEAINVELNEKFQIGSERCQDLDLENQQMQDVVHQMRIDMESMPAHVQEQNENWQAIIQEKEEKIYTMTRKLQDAVEELQKSAQERSRLVEMSNSIRASIRKPQTVTVATQYLLDSSSFKNPPAIPVTTTTKKPNTKPLASSLPTPNSKVKQTADQLRKSLIRKQQVRNYNEKV